MNNVNRFDQGLTMPKKIRQVSSSWNASSTNDADRTPPARSSSQTFAQTPVSRPRGGQIGGPSGARVSPGASSSSSAAKKSADAEAAKLAKLAQMRAEAAARLQRLQEEARDVGADAEDVREDLDYFAGSSERRGLTDSDRAQVQRLREDGDRMVQGIDDNVYQRTESQAGGYDAQRPPEEHRGRQR